MTTDTTAWPENVIARYLTIGGAAVELAEESSYNHVNIATQTASTCLGCTERHVEEWGWDFWANERGEKQPDSYQRRGEQATPKARRWAQRHAETCRAMPKPEADWT